MQLSELDELRSFKYPNYCCVITHPPSKVVQGLSPMTWRRHANGKKDVLPPLID